jgi:copper(I)-binding protein
MFRVSATAVAVLLALGVSTASAQKVVETSDGWIRLPSAGETTARAFATIDNPTMYDVYFVSAAADVAESVQFLQVAAGGGPGTLVKELTAPAYGKVELKPDGVHLVLNGLKRPLKPGETIAITIATETNAVTLNAVVKN